MKQLIFLLLFTSAIFAQSGKSVLTQAQKDSIKSLMGFSSSTLDKTIPMWDSTAQTLSAISKDSLWQFLNVSDSIENGVISINSYGGVGDNSTDNYSAITTALALEKIVMIGSSVKDTFLISKPIQVPSYSRIILNGYLKMQDGYERLLTANASVGDNTITVDNAGTYFEVGQWVTISDDDKATQGGDTGQTRKVGSTSYITDIDGNTITLADTLIYNFTTSANAKIGHTQSVFLIDSKTNIVIEGSGIIDQNKANQYDVEPVFSNEEVRAGCGIAVYNSTYITVKGITVKNVLLHNISNRSSDYLKYYDLTLDAAHDKNILFWACDYIEINNLVTKNADYEEGITFYAANTYIRANNILASNNGRYGILLNADNTDAIISNYTSINNGGGMFIKASDAVINNINIYGGGVRRYIATKEYGLGIMNAKNIKITNFVIDSILSADYNLKISGSSENVNLSNGSIRGTLSSSNSGYGIYIDEEDNNNLYPNNITLNSVLFQNLKEAVHFVDGTNIKFVDGVFDGNTSDYNTTDTELEFIRCDGIALSETGLSYDIAGSLVNPESFQDLLIDFTSQALTIDSVIVESADSTIQFNLSYRDSIDGQDNYFLPLYEEVSTKQTLTDFENSAIVPANKYWFINIGTVYGAIKEKLFIKIYYGN